MALKIGLIGLDTSHVVAFTRLLNDPTDREHIPGGRVTAAFPGGSKDFELSYSRLDGFTNELRDRFNVPIMDSPEAVAEASDVVFITSVDGRVHLNQFRRIAKFKKPTFIDKPLATTVADAAEIFRIADDAGIAVMSSSSLRYAEALTQALSSAGEGGAIVGCDVFGPMSEQPTQPGLFWYGVHLVEVLETVMGPGCREVRATRNEEGDLIVGIWSDGRMAGLRGMRKGHNKYGVTLHREKNYQFVDMLAGGKSWYAGLLEAILSSLPRGRSDVPREQTLEVMRFIEAANESRKSGKAVKL